MSPSLRRRAVAEALASGLLVMIVVGSGIAAERLSPGDAGLQLLQNTAATAGGLVALILAFGPVSGAHLNPVVSVADRLLGGLTTGELVAYVGAQLAGGCGGAILANLMFDLPAVTAATTARSGGHLWLAESVATAGLLLIVLGVVRSGQVGASPYAVAAWITAAYWSTSSTSFANPAVTVARSLTDTFTGIEPASVPAFVAAQLAGGAAGLALGHYLHPHVPADAVLVPHESDTTHP